MSAVIAFGLSAPAAFTARLSLAKRQSRRMQVCRAEEEDRKLTFDSNRRSGMGFTESDSAGQTNIFSVEPKMYVSGTGADETSGSANDTLSLAAVAGTVAAGAIVAGLVTVGSVTTVDELIAFDSQYQPLSVYKTQFISELAASAPAPAAPAVVDE